LRKQRGKSDVISTVLNELIIMIRELLIAIKISSSKLELQKCLLWRTKKRNRRLLWTIILWISKS